MALRTVSTLFLMIFILAACSRVPVTGRKQLNIIPDGEIMAMSYSEYSNFIKTNKLSSDRANTNMVKSVGRKIQTAVEQYMAQNGWSSNLKGYEWEFNLIESNDVNAWCMPGGKVVVYTGILPITRTETGLAVVMGHEIAHAIAEHGGERMTQQLIAQMGGVALNAALSSEPQKTRSLWMAAYGLGAQYGVLMPYGRTQESEADQMGLIFMAMAGYNPNEAIDFWKRMSKAGGAKPPEFLSTHPSDETRINDLKKHLPEAMKYYKQ